MKLFEVKYYMVIIWINMKLLWDLGLLCLSLQHLWFRLHLYIQLCRLRCQVMKVQEFWAFFNLFWIVGYSSAGFYRDDTAFVKNGYSRRVITSVFKFFKPFYKYRDSIFFSRKADYATHRQNLKGYAFIMWEPWEHTCLSFVTFTFYFGNAWTLFPGYPGICIIHNDIPLMPEGIRRKIR